jgi:hypothetical protein
MRDYIGKVMKKYRKGLVVGGCIVAGFLPGCFDGHDSAGGYGGSSYPPAKKAAPLDNTPEAQSGYKVINGYQIIDILKTKDGSIYVVRGPDGKEELVPINRTPEAPDITIFNDDPGWLDRNLARLKKIEDDAARDTRRIIRHTQKGLGY